MKLCFFVVAILYLQSNIVLSATVPKNYFNIGGGIATFKKPLLYNYSAEFGHDFKITRKSSLMIGAECDYFYQLHKYGVDTNFFSYSGPSGPNVIRYYDIKYKVSTINFIIAYKYWIKKHKSYAMYLQTELNFAYIFKNHYEYSYYYRDTNQVLFPGPHKYKSETDYGNRGFITDNIRPAVLFGYLKNINRDLALHFKLEFVFGIPYQNPKTMAVIYPKLGLGLAF